MSEQNPEGTGGTTTTTTTDNAQAGAGSATPPAQTPSSWLDSLGELKGYAELKAWKEPKDVVTSYQNFEKFKGVPQERLLTLPEKEDDANWDVVYQRLGKPATKNDYKVDAGDPKVTEFVKEMFHGANLSQKQAEMVLNKFMEFNKNEEVALQDAYKAKLEGEVTGLKKEWGMAYNENIQKAKTAASKLGLDAQTIDQMENVLGHKKLMTILEKVGSSVGEDSYVNGKSQGFQPLSPAAAQAKISMLMSDKTWGKRYMDGDKGARQEFETLHKMAFPTN